MKLQPVCDWCVGSLVEEYGEVCTSVSGVREILSCIDSQVDEQRHLVEIFSRLQDTPRGQSFTGVNATTNHFYVCSVLLLQSEWRHMGDSCSQARGCKTFYATATSSSCFSKIHNGSACWCRLTHVVMKMRPLNGCSSSGSSSSSSNDQKSEADKVCRKVNSI